MEKLSLARPLDNLEFMQWAKAFFDLNARSVEYDALERRKNKPTPWDGGSGAAGSRTGAPAANRNPRAVTMPSQGAKKITTGPAAVRKISDQPKQGTTGPAKNPTAAASAAEIKRLNDKIAEIAMQNDILEKEKEFYFGKLRDIEIFCGHQESVNNPTA